jgi:hypothetical protein
MFLNESLIICYSTPNYGDLTNISLSSLYELGISTNNIRHKLDTNVPNVLINKKDTGFMSDLFYYCIINKVKHLINVLVEEYELNNTTYKYYISLDLDIWFLKQNISEFQNLDKFVSNNKNNIIFMRENTTNMVNAGFFIIKRCYLIEAISFLKMIYFKLITTSRTNLPMLEQQLINEHLYKIKFDYIPNDYVIFGETVYNKDKSLLHHAVCCINTTSKIEQINKIKQMFNH